MTGSFEFRFNEHFHSDVAKMTKEAIEKIKCPEHGTGPTVSMEGISKFEVKCCCDKLKAKVSEQFAKK